MSDPGARGTGGAERAQNIVDPTRPGAPEPTGLGAEVDAEMEGFAAWVRRAVNVPVALVSLVRGEMQLFPEWPAAPNRGRPTGRPR